MRKIHLDTSILIPATPETIYAVLADYTVGHQRILPHGYFHDFRVEEGGVGAGTIVSFTVKLGGATRNYRDRIAEPQPGRVLEEHGLLDDHVTTFTLTPEGDQTRVTITMNYSAQPGFIGIMEAWVAPKLLHSMVLKELNNLAAYVREPAALSA